MVDGTVQDLPSWLKGVIAIGTGTMVGVLVAYLLMGLGI